MGRMGCFVLTMVIAAALAAVAVWLLVLLTRDAKPASVDDAVAAFREELGGREPASEPIPEGVYLYATDGEESTDALTGVTNVYPPRSTITILRDGCGVRLRWDVLEGRSTTWLVCTGSGDWTLASQDERHTFFGRTERTTYVCEDTAFRPVGDGVGATFDVRCSTGSAVEEGSGRVVARAALPVGGHDVETVHLSRVTELTGDTRGQTRHDVWLDRETGVPVRVVMTTETENDAPIGDVRYEEDVRLALESLEPRR